MSQAIEGDDKPRGWRPWRHPLRPLRPRATLADEAASAVARFG